MNLISAGGIMRSLISFTFFVFLLQSCSSHAPQSQYQFPKVESTSYKGLLFTLIDKKYTASVLYWYDFKTGHVKEILSGLSGDPALFVLGKKVFLFNRLGFQKNFLVLDSENDFSILSAEKESGLVNGDPSFLSALNETYALASCQAENKIKLFNLKTGTFQNLYPGEPDPSFRPGNLIIQENDGRKEVFALSLGVDESWRPNQSQKIIRWSLTESPTFSLSYREEKPTHNTWSQTLFQDPEERNTLHSLSLSYGEGSASYDNIYLSPYEMRVTKKNDLVTLGTHIKRGTPLFTIKKEFFIPLQLNNRTVVYKFNTVNESIDIFFRSNQSAREISLIYGPEDDFLFIGEGSDQEEGKLHLFKGEEKIFSSSFELNFYKGVLIP